MCRKRIGRNQRRAGFTLLEMLVASASATILIAGLGTSVFIASRAYDDADSVAVKKMDAIFAADELMTDMQLARRFHERTTTSVEFTVPDRDGDGVDETIRYAWSGVSGAPLTRTYNSSPAESILDSVANLNLDYITRTIKGLDAPVIFKPEVVFESFEETKLSQAAESISIEVPTGVEESDLLIAVVAVDKNLKSHFEQGVAGWNLLLTDVENSNISLGVWWRLASGSEPTEYSFSFDRTVGAYGWMMRFTGHDTTSPIDNSNVLTGRSKTPTAPAVTTSVNDALILRIGAFDDASVEVDQAGIASATTITADSVPAASGAAAYELLEESGDSGKEDFQLISTEDYVTATIAITPAREASK